MKKIACIIFFIAVAMIGFRSIVVHEEIPEKDKIVHALVEKAVVKLSKKYDMHCCATGIGMPGGIVTRLGLDFDIVGPLSKEKIRQILIESGQDFLAMINADKNLQPLLKHRPFELNDIQIIIFLQDRSGYGIDNPNIRVGSIGENLQYEYLIDEFDVELKVDIPKLIKTEEESYEEALDALKKNKGLQS